MAKRHIKLNLNDLKDFDKNLKKLNRFQYLGGASNQKLGGVCFEISKYIAEKATEGYKNAKYNGRKVVANAVETAPYTCTSGSYDVAVCYYHIRDPQNNKFNETSYQHYQVVACGRLASILEFGSGDRFIPEGYSSKAGASAWSNSKKREYHFISNLTGKETWVYSGEQGTNPYTEDGGHTRKDHNKYYSAGNEPCRALFDAVEYVKVNYAEFYNKAKLYRSGRKEVKL